MLQEDKKGHHFNQPVKHLLEKFFHIITHSDLSETFLLLNPLTDTICTREDKSKNRKSRTQSFRDNKI